ncbi:MAG: Uracil-DNA glycosylase superfamily [Pseudonocardiales bacterium]|nr:Uracil-DNA glycosylase superfamily [Pseudonocardiales bacterium]
MGFTRSQLESYRGGTLPDLIGPSVRLLFVGINPGLWTVATQSHFGRRGNRFYPALYRAGIVDHVIDASAGFVAADVAHLKERGVGITNLFAGATARADEIEPAALVAGAGRLRERVQRIAPTVVAILGVTAYRIAFGERRAGVGRQAVKFGASQVWVLPNPSGLNAHETVASLASAYREAAVAAGMTMYPAS